MQPKNEHLLKNKYLKHGVKRADARVLLVDDNDGVLEISKIFIERFGKGKIKVDSIKDPTEVIKTLKSDKYDVIISDDRMPRISGVELLEEIRLAGFRIPFIIFSGSSKREDSLYALNKGADYYIRKDADPVATYIKIVDIIYQLVNRKQMEQIFIECEKRFKHLIQSASLSKSL